VIIDLPALVPPTCVEPRGWKSAAKATCRAIIATTPEGAQLSPECQDWVLRLMAARHPGWAQKSSRGVSHLIVRWEPRFKLNKQFALVRPDGTVTDISWQEAISPKPFSGKIKQAMRAAVSDQVAAYKRECERDNYVLRCAACRAKGLPLEVDHFPQTFASLAASYVREIADGELDWNRVALDEVDADGQWGSRLAAEHLLVWSEYHRAYARYRLVCKACNCARNKKGSL
jgi:hypothetical protein